MRVTIITALFLVLASCATESAYTVQDRWWIWVSQACKHYTKCIPVTKSGGGITVQCSTETKILCTATSSGNELPPTSPELPCTGSFYRDNVSYLATIKPDGEDPTTVRFHKGLWETMTPGGKVCLRLSFGHASRCKGN